MNRLMVSFAKALMAAVLLNVVMLAGARAQYIDCLPERTPSYAKPKSTRSESVVVFIHGLHGGGAATWTATGLFGGPIAAWPCLLLADQEVFRDSSVYLAEYRSEVARPNPSVAEVAQDIVRDLDTQGVLLHTHVTVVAHSMGGIVLARMLTAPGLLSVEQRSRVRLVVFLGTPALPTEAASICAKFGVNAQCAEMSDAVKMAALWDTWDRLAPKPAAWCVAEGADMWLSLWWLRVVSEESAWRPCRHAELRSVAQGLDHSEVVKPQSIERRPHRDLRNAFAACVKPRLTSAAVRSEAEQRLAEAGNRWFYGLKDRLLIEQADWTQLLELSLASASDVKRFWYPLDNTPSFDAARYERLGTNAFVQAVRQSLPALLPLADVAWVEPVRRIAQRVPDSAIETLLRQFRDTGGLRDDDVVLALVARPEIDGQFLLLLRPGSSNHPAGGQAAAFGVVGLVLIPRPVEACRA